MPKTAVAPPPDDSQDDEQDDQSQGGAPQDPAGAGAPNVSPDEQQAYDVVVTMAMNIIYNRKSFGQVIMKLASGRDNMAKIIGHTALMITLSVKNTAEANGKQIPDHVLYHASHEIIGMLCEIAVATKMITQASVPTVSTAALMWGVKYWGLQAQKSNEITQPDQQAGAQQLAQYGIHPSADSLPVQPAGSPQPDNPTLPPPQGAAGQGPPPQGVANQGISQGAQ